MHNRKGARYNTEHPNLSKKGYRFVKMYKKKFVNFSVTLAFLIAMTREEDIGTRSDRAGPSFSVRPEKKAKGAVLQERTLQIHCAQNSYLEAKAALHQTGGVAREGISSRSGETKRLPV